MADTFVSPVSEQAVSAPAAAAPFGYPVVMTEVAATSMTEVVATSGIWHPPTRHHKIQLCAYYPLTKVTGPAPSSRARRNHALSPYQRFTVPMPATVR